MRVLLTGVPGWLGNRFLEVLVKGADGASAPNDWQIRCFVLQGSDISWINKLDPRIECVAGDLVTNQGLPEALRGVDVVFHIAGIIHPRKISELYQLNEHGTRNILQAAASAGVRRLIYISSNSVAGVNQNRELLMKEEDVPRPYLNYGLSKYRAEQAVREFQQSGKIETVSLRPCWFYGPNQPPRQTTFFKMIQKGNPLIFGDGSNLRSMSYLDNVCQAMILAAQSSRANGQTYWIADRRPYTMNEIYQTVAELLDVKVFRPRRLPGLISEACLLADRGLQRLGRYVKEVHVAGEMNKNIACSIEKAVNELGYNPRIELKEGMRRSIEWCRNNGMEI